MTRIKQSGDFDVPGILPYGKDFLWVDRIIDIEVGKSVITEKDYSCNDPIVAAHFAKGPKIVPGTILTEQICQSAYFLALVSSSFDNDAILVLCDVRSKYPNAAQPNCTVRAYVQFEEPVFGALLFTGHADCGCKRVATVTRATAQWHRGPS